MKRVRAAHKGIFADKLLSAERRTRAEIAQVL
jgi:hypothetical protein